MDRLLLLLILVGLGFSGFSAAETYQPDLQGACTVNSFLSCRAVAQSAYSQIGPIPTWSLGLGGFVVLLVFTILFVRNHRPRDLNVILALAALGLAVAAVLLAVEIFLIQALCLICLGAYLANLGVFLVVWRIRGTRLAGLAAGTVG